jgi:hypothetical protein
LERVTKLGVGAFLLAGLGMMYWSASEETAPIPEPSASPVAQNAQDSKRPNISQPLKAASALPPIDAPPSIQIQAEPQRIDFKSDNECMATMFYRRSLSPTKNPDDKFSNLRWAVESFQGKDMPETFKNAANTLGVDKSKLISDLRAAALSVFKDASTSDLKTNQDWVNYWNSQKIAYRYTGLTDTGEFNDTLATAYVSYTPDTLMENRDIYMLNAAKEIVRTIKPILDMIETSHNENKNNGLRRGPSLDKALEKLDLNQKVALREQIAIITYVTDTILAAHSESYMMIGLSVEHYDLMNRITFSGLLNQKINSTLSEQCKLETASLKPR